MAAGMSLPSPAPDAALAAVERPFRPIGGAGLDHVFKILVTGPFAAGKTSLIQSVSQTPVVSTDVATTGDELTVKALTTVAMDFGTFRIDGGGGDGDEADEPMDGVQLLLFGTPGQERFWFMTDVLKGEVNVVTFVVDAEAEHTHAEAGAAMRALLKDLRVPLVVAVNRCDDLDRATVLARSLGTLTCEPVVPCQLIDPASGRDVVIEALLTLLESMEGPSSGWHVGVPQLAGALCRSTRRPPICSGSTTTGRGRDGSCSTLPGHSASRARSSSRRSRACACTSISARSTSPSASPIRRSGRGSCRRVR
ncbi:MAG: GTP-binding protein [Ilumatobacteraceae bacterium]